jgi:hypothetical protein
MRRAAHEALTKVAVQRYHPIETKEATILVSALLSSPESREQHFQRTAASAIMSITYDYPTITSGLEKVVQDMGIRIHQGVRAAAGTSLVEFFPWMIHIPERSTLSPQFQYCIPSYELTGLRSGRGKSLSKLPSVPKHFYNYSIVSK